MNTVLKASFASKNNVASYLKTAAQKYPTKLAVVAPRGQDRAQRLSYTHLTFKQLDEESDRYAHGLAKKGIKKGTRVLMMIPPGPEFIALWFALLKLGAVVVLIDPGMGRKNLFECIAKVQPEALIAIPIVHILKAVFRKPFKTVKTSIAKLKSIREEKWQKFEIAEVDPEESAAIVFTTGSTGVPKGVVYAHKTLEAHIESFKRNFNITEDDIGFPAFLPFSLYCIAIGTTAIMPPMDPRHPKDVDAKEVMELIRHHQPTYSFGSPAFWKTISSCCTIENIQLPSFKRVMMFGAPVREEVLAELEEILPNGEAYTPYGATEALPLCSFAGSEILAETLAQTKQGKGVCVGRALAGIELKIIKITENTISNLSEAKELAENEIGEIIVKGSVVTEQYFNLPQHTKLAKIWDGQEIWHRMGDVGYLDNQDRLWFCGRKNHRVITNNGTLFTVPIEAIFNQHPAVAKSALVGVSTKPVVLYREKIESL